MCIYSFHFLNKKKKNFSFTFAVLSVNFEFQQLWLLVWHLLDFIHLTLNSCKISSASMSWTGCIFMAWIFRLGFLLSQWILRVSSFECLFCFSLCSTIWPFNSCFVCWSLAWLCFLFFFFFGSEEPYSAHAPTFRMSSTFLISRFFIFSPLFLSSLAEATKCIDDL